MGENTITLHVNTSKSDVNILLSHVLIDFYSKMAYSYFHVKLLALITMPLPASRFFNSKVKFFKKNKKMLIYCSIHTLEFDHKLELWSQLNQQNSNSDL